MLRYAAVYLVHIAKRDIGNVMDNNHFLKSKGEIHMIYSREVEEMCPVAQGVNHGCAPIPEEAKWVKAKNVQDISGLTHGIGWCAPQQGACK